VWTHRDVRDAVASTPYALPSLPDGVGFNIAFRRMIRSGPSDGVPVEDLGVRGEPYAMTKNDLLNHNSDLLRHCIELLRTQAQTARSRPGAARRGARSPLAVGWAAARGASPSGKTPRRRKRSRVASCAGPRDSGSKASWRDSVSIAATSASTRTSTASTAKAQ